jgi:hypothetical protein
MIAATIHQKIADALKAGDEIKLSTYRLLASAFNYEKIAKQHELSEEEELVVVKREAKKRKDAIESYASVKGKQGFESTLSIEDRIKKEEEELKILNEFLPAEMPEEELTKIVEETIKEMGVVGIQNTGKVIGAVMSKVRGKTDGGRVSEIVKKLLSE